MVKLASPHELVDPPVRHGTCRLQITIGATSYSLRPIPSQPRGITVWVLRALDGPRAGARYSVASVNRQAGCTCPDHETNGATCKHVMALRVIGLIPRTARTVREASAEQTARAARRPAKALADLADRIHAAPPAPPSGRDQLARARRLHGKALASEKRVQTKLSASAPGPAEDFATGFRSAIHAHVAALASPASPSLPKIGGAQ
jgi:hypothetical protein